MMKGLATVCVDTTAAALVARPRGARTSSVVWTLDFWGLPVVKSV